MLFLNILIERLWSIYVFNLAVLLDVGRYVRVSRDIVKIQTGSKYSVLAFDITGVNFRVCQAFCGRKYSAEEIQA